MKYGDKIFEEIEEEKYNSMRYKIHKELEYSESDKNLTKLENKKWFSEEEIKKVLNKHLKAYDAIGQDYVYDYETEICKELFGDD